MTDDDLKLLKALSVRLAGLLQEPEPGQAVWRQLLADILGDLAGYAPKREDTQLAQLRGELDLCKRDLKKLDSFDRRLARMQASLLRLRRDIDGALKEDDDDAPRFTEGQLENTARHIRSREEGSSFFLAAECRSSFGDVAVYTQGDPTDDWKQRVCKLAGCVPVTFVHGPTAASEVEPQPPSYSDEDLELAKQAICERFWYEFRRDGCFVGIGRQPGNRGIEIFLARQSGQHSPSHLQSMLGGIPVRLTVAGMLPPRPWSPPGFAEAYAEAHKWAANDKPSKSGVSTGFTTAEPIPVSSIPVSPAVGEVIEKSTGAEEAQKLLPPLQLKGRPTQENVKQMLDEIRKLYISSRTHWYQNSVERTGYVEVLCNTDVPARVKARIRALHPSVPVVFTVIGPLKML